MKKVLGLMAASALMLASCDKTVDEPKPVVKTKTDHLTAGKWQLTASSETYMENGQTKTDDYFADLEACDKDDFLLFGTDGKVTSDEGADKCDSTADQSHTFEWAFYENETKMILSDDGFADTLTIDELSESVLKLSSVYTFDGVEYKSEQAFGRIN